MATIERRIKEADFSNLSEPQMSDQDWEDFNEGIVLFNSGKFWESHEAWEEVWKRHPENSRIFFQGLIQVAAGLHQLRRNIYHGVEKHFRNALWKLEPFQAVFLEIDVKSLVEIIKEGQKELARLGEKNLDNFSSRLIPKIIKVINST